MPLAQCRGALPEATQRERENGREHGEHRKSRQVGLVQHSAVRREYQDICGAKDEEGDGEREEQKQGVAAPRRSGEKRHGGQVGAATKVVLVENSR